MSGDSNFIKINFSLRKLVSPLSRDAREEMQVYTLTKL